jgi:hypothetical protein
MYLTVVSWFLISFVLGGRGPSRVNKFLYAPAHPPPSVWALKPPLWALVHKTTYALMIYTALCIMFWTRAYPLLGQVGGGWALEILSFLGPKWHSPIGSMTLHRAQKTLELQGPIPSHLPSLWICTHPKHYAQGNINHRCINSYIVVYACLVMENYFIVIISWG